MFHMTVDDVFFIRGRGTVVTGRVEVGEIRVGDEVQVAEHSGVRVDGIEAFRKQMDSAQAGEDVGLLLRGLDRADVHAGDAVSAS
jgi:elongation factor Tu